MLGATVMAVCIEILYVLPLAQSKEQARVKTRWAVEAEKPVHNILVIVDILRFFIAYF